MRKKSSQGFTLVEVMVAIAIIGILATVSYSYFSNARAIARDKARMASLKELQLAIQLYKSENGRYPAAGCAAAGAPGAWRTPGPVSGHISCDLYIDGLVPDYIAELPVDPNNENAVSRGIFYRTSSDGNGTFYKLLFYGTVEKLLITSYGDEFARCPVPSIPPSATCPADALVSDATNNLIETSYAVYSQSAEGI